MSPPRALALVCFVLALGLGARVLLAPSPGAASARLSPLIVAPIAPGGPVTLAPLATGAPVAVLAPIGSVALPPADDSPCARALLARAPAPGDPLDPTFHVNRWRAIPDDFPTSGSPLWTPCNAPAPPSTRPGLDLLCVPRRAALHSPEALRQLAWDSPAPPDRATTHDRLPVGRAGRVGFGPMLAAARAEGHELKIRSGFRPRGSQATVFQTWVNERLRQGLSPAEAERHAGASSARPGHSEHQLGTTADLVHRDPDGTFYEGWDSERIAASPPMRWLAAHAHRFGLVLSYGRETTAVTQYVWEPWHYRFVGVEVADTLHRCGLPLEAYLRARHGDGEPPAFELPR